MDKICNCIKYSHLDKCIIDIYALVLLKDEKLFVRL